MDALSRLFDAGTVGGLLALASVHVHLGLAHHKAAKQLRQQRAELDALAQGHQGDPADHRNIPQLLTEARRHA